MINEMNSKSLTPKESLIKNHVYFEVSTVPVDGPPPSGARASVRTVMMTFE